MDGFWLILTFRDEDMSVVLLVRFLYQGYTHLLYILKGRREGLNSFLLSFLSSPSPFQLPPSLLPLSVLVVQCEHSALRLYLISQVL